MMSLSFEEKKKSMGLSFSFRLGNVGFLNVLREISVGQT